MAVWDVTEPADTDKIKDFPLLHRGDKTTLKTEIELEHATLGGGTGYHKLPVQAAPAPTGAEGRLAIIDDILQYYSNGAWRSIIASGVRQIFDQDAAPTGWTRDAVINDKVIRIVSGARADGGTWTVGGITVDSHVLTITEIPPHAHNYNRLTLNRADIGGGALMRGPPDPATATTSVGGGAGHVHGLTSDGTWRPLHRDMILCEKD